MAKTRRQRALEHPDMPKKGVRDKSRIPTEKTEEQKAAAAVMGRMGGKADHGSRGLQTAGERTKRKVAMAGVKAKQKLRKQKEKEIQDAERKGSERETA